MFDLVPDTTRVVLDVLATDATHFGDIENISLVNWAFRLEILALYFKYHPPLHRPAPPPELNQSFLRIQSVADAFSVHPTSAYDDIVSSLDVDAKKLFGMKYKDSFARFPHVKTLLVRDAYTLPTEMHQVRIMFPSLKRLKLLGPRIPHHLDVLPLLRVLTIDSLQELELLHSGHIAMDSRTYRALCVAFKRTLLGYTPVIESSTAEINLSLKHMPNLHVLRLGHVAAPRATLANLFAQHIQHSPAPDIDGLGTWWISRLPQYFTRLVDCEMCLRDAKEEVERSERHFCREICEGHPSLSVVTVRSPFFEDAEAHTVEYKRSDWATP